MEKEQCDILIVDCDISLYHVEKLKVAEKINEHSEAWFTAGIDEAGSRIAINELGADSIIKILRKTEKEEHLLFEGLINEYKIHEMGGILKIDMHLISLSHYYDIKIKKKSYQANFTFYNIFKTIVKGSNNGDLLYSGDKKQVQDMPYLQMDETDWDFMKRIASYNKMPLMNYMGNKRPQLLIGFPEREPTKIKEYEFSVKNHFGEYLEKRNQGITCKETDLFDYIIVSKDFHRLGDAIRYKEVSYRIIEKHIDLVDSLLRYEYHLRDEVGGTPKEVSNKDTTGVVIEGSVLEVKKDRALVHLSVDEEQNKENAHWFRIAAAYGNTGKGGSFCMPEAGDQVRVFFSDNRKNMSYIDGVIRQDGETNSKTEDTAVYCFETSEGKELKCDSSSVTITSSETVKITLSNETGISIDSSENIQITSDKEIVFKAAKIEMKASDGIEIMTGFSNIIVDETIHLKGLEGVFDNGKPAK